MDKVPTHPQRDAAPWRPLVTALSLPLRLLPAPLLEHLLGALATARARRLPPDRALSMLLRLDQVLYLETGRQSVRYGGGVHTKHRHMDYHRFFVERITPGQRVLDVGCGIGAVAADLAERAQAQVLAVDYSQKNIDKAKRAHDHPRLTFVLGNVLTDIPDERFDVIVLSNVLEHIHDRPGLLRALVANHHPQTLLIRVPCFERDWRVPLKRELGLDERLDADHKTEYTLESFHEETRQAGLTVTHLEVRWGEIWSSLTPVPAPGSTPRSAPGSGPGTTPAEPARHD